MYSSSSSGIIYKDSSNIFLFLYSDQKVMGTYIPAFQAFETSLLMIGIGRWTNALISINSAIENLLRCDKGESDRTDFKTLIDERAAANKVSADLRSSAHRVRIKRNEFIHRSVIPEDNSEAIFLYLCDALSVFKVFADRICNVDLYDCLDEVLSENLVFTKNIVQSFKNYDVAQENLHTILSVLVKTISNHTHLLMTPQLMSEFPDEHSSWTGWDALKDAEITINETWSDMDFEHGAVRCPTSCSGFLSLGFYSREENCELASCAKCGLVILDRVILKKFVDPHLTN